MNWPLVPLGRALRYRKEFITIDDLKSYKRCRVQWYGQGAIIRDQVPGSEIKTKQQQVCKPHELLVAEIDAKEGGFAVVPPELDGAVVSSHYFLFDIDTTKLIPAFLAAFLRTPAFQSQVSAQGTTNYSAVRPGHVLEYTIPLPPLPEQRRIVARVDAIASRVAAARRLREEAKAESLACFISERSRRFTSLAQHGTVPLSSAAFLERGRFLHRPRNEPRFFGGQHPWIQIAEIESAKKYITTHTATLNDLGLAISRKFPRGTLLVSIAATIGAVGILSFDCCVPDSIVAVQPKEGVDNEYLFHWLGYVRSDLERIAPQSAQKNINLQILSELPIPIPPLDEQRRIVSHLDALQAKLDAVRAEQAATAAELDALLPSVLNRAFAGEL